MAVNRIERIGGFCKYPLPVTAILYLAVNGVPCDAVGMHDGYLIPARSHTRVERRDDAIFDGAHDLIRVCHVVDCDVHRMFCDECRDAFFRVTDAAAGRARFPVKSCRTDKDCAVMRPLSITAVKSRHLTVFIVDASALYVPRR